MDTLPHRRICVGDTVIYNGRLFEVTQCNDTHANIFAPEIIDYSDEGVVGLCAEDFVAKYRGTIRGPLFLDYSNAQLPPVPRRAVSLPADTRNGIPLEELQLARG